MVMLTNTDCLNLKMPITLINTPREVEDEIMLDESPRNNNNNTQKPFLDSTGALSP